MKNDLNQSKVPFISKLAMAWEMLAVISAGCLSGIS